MIKKIIADFDDASLLNFRWDLLNGLKEHYPNLKVSMFTIPYDIRYEKDLQKKIFRKKALEILHKNLDWIQIIPHGLLHLDREFENADKKTMELALKAIDQQFKNDGIPYEKGFKAPFWLWNQDVVDVLNDNGWWGAVDPRQPQMLRTKKFYRYDYLTNEKFYKEDKEIMKIHGHIDGVSDNDIERTYINLLKIPTDAEFGFVTDDLETL